MTAPTLHKTFNKELQKMDIMSGNVFSNLQSSMYVRGVNNLECNGFEFSKGELFTRDLNIVDKFSNRSRLPMDFQEKLYEVCEKGDACVYVFKNPAGSECLSIAISNKEGLQYFNEIGKSPKQQSVNSYIINTLNEKGWF